MMMRGEKKSPGLKILWFWVLGTAAVLVGSGARSSMREIDAMIQSDEKQNLRKQIAEGGGESVIVDGGGLKSGEGFVKDNDEL